jgi:hypothetical protein
VYAPEAEDLLDEAETVVRADTVEKAFARRRDVESLQREVRRPPASS